MSSYIKINIKQKKVLSVNHDLNHACDQSAIKAVKSKIEIKEISKVSDFTPI